MSIKTDAQNFMGPVVIIEAGPLTADDMFWDIFHWYMTGENIEWGE